MKVIDIVKPPARTSLEAHRRWKNRLQSELQSLPYYHKRKIEIIYIGSVDCAGNGRRYCEEQGEHSWFNHSMDSYYANNASNLPEGFVEW